MKLEKIDLDKNQIKLILEKALKKSKTYSQEECQDIVFHMTDWIDDLVELFKLYMNPDKYKNKKVVDILVDFLVHVPNHVAAASKLLLDQSISDTWNLGVADEDKDI
jgi:hypothetical protein